MWYLFDYPMFGRKMIGKMGIPVPGESDMVDADDIRKRTLLKPFEITIDGESTAIITINCYSMGHALKLASNLSLDDVEFVTVRREE